LSIVFLGLGSNIGRRKENLLEAMDRLRGEGIGILSKARPIETEPVGGVPQGKFLNTVIKVETDLDPESLLRLVKSIERRMGRKKDVRFGPRIIDIDILLFDDVQMETKNLTIPHPRMFEREFVMKPLKEIAPGISQDHPHAHH
jgi:2-amino-4-hydroxy-6-hydroxymethyldihydropteridine diphosphokinase